MQPDGALRAANHLLAPIEEASGPVAIKLELVFGMRYSRFIQRKGEGTGGNVKGGRLTSAEHLRFLNLFIFHILPPRPRSPGEEKNPMGSSLPSKSTGEQI